ncbi:MAG: ATP-binding protein [bacterium]
MNDKITLPEAESPEDVELSMDRSNDDEISLRSKRVYDSVFYNHPAKDILDSLFDIVLILDVNRQAVFVNRVLLDHMGLKDPAPILGRRPGEIFDCIYARDLECGCGTTRFCAICAARRAIMEGLHGRVAVDECRIAKSDGTAVELGISSAPLNIDGERFVLFVAKDISDQKRMLALEQVFFHDVLNISAAIWGLASILKDGLSERHDEIGKKIYVATNRLIGEIEAQRNLLLAEDNRLAVNKGQIESLGIIKELVSLYETYSVCTKKTIELDPLSENIAFESDVVLLRRVVENMLKNALEASKKSEVIKIGCRNKGNCVEFWVHNSGCMAQDVQLQIFKRGFSTKTSERGLGTYSMKLITERFLRGSVSFESSMEGGTTFYARYPLVL